MLSETSAHKPRVTRLAGERNWRTVPLQLFREANLECQTLACGSCPLSIRRGNVLDVVAHEPRQAAPRPSACRLSGGAMCRTLRRTAPTAAPVNLSKSECAAPRHV